MAELLRRMECNIGSRLQKTIEDSRVELLGQLNTVMGSTIREYDARISQKFKQVDANMSVQAARLDDVEEGQRRMAASLADLQKELELHKRPGGVLPSDVDVDWARDPLPHVVRVNSTHSVRQAEVEKLIKQLAEEAAMPPQCWDIRRTGPDPGQRFCVIFKGDAITAGRRASKLLATLRGDDGVWRRFEIPAAAGGTSPIFLGEDKSPQQTKVEQATKRLLGIVKECHPSPEWRFLRREGAIAHGWTRVVRVVAPSRNECKLEWDHNAATEIDIVEKEVSDKFGTGSGPVTQWRP